MQDIRAKLLAELRKADPDYELSREYVGQFLHILQMFYSNTNWIESNGQNMLPAIGKILGYTRFLVYSLPFCMFV